VGRSLSHARALRTPREVRHALVYVLMNFKKHGGRAAHRLDAMSSARWFDGWKPALGQLICRQVERWSSDLFGRHARGLLDEGGAFTDWFG
jgi:hypothetical protein